MLTYNLSRCDIVISMFLTIVFDLNVSMNVKPRSMKSIVSSHDTDLLLFFFIPRNMKRPLKKIVCNILYFQSLPNPS